MEKKQIITLTGKPGTGKSSTARVLAERLGYEKYSSGDFMRQLALERGRDITTNSEVALSDRALDDIVDGRQRELGETNDRFVMDGRMGWLMIPHSFKVYLTTDPWVAAERVQTGEKNAARLASENIDQPLGDYVEEVATRVRHDEQRYLKLYGVTPFDEAHYDVVIDNTSLSSDEVIARIIECYGRWLSET